MSHTKGDADNHKTEYNFIPTSSWGEESFVDVDIVEKNLLEIKERIAPCKPMILLIPSGPA